MIGPPPPDYRRLLRRVLKIESRLRRYRPRLAEAPPPPERAHEVLAAIARAHAPGDRVGIREIIEAAGIGQGAAGEVRRWAAHPRVGLWPYRKGAPRAADWSERGLEGGGDI